MGKIAKNIRHLRKLKNWSQEELGDRLDIPRSRIGSYEEERCDPPLDILIRISNLFHIAIDALVKCDLTKVDSTSLMKVGENRILFPVMVDKDNHDIVEVVTAKASAGYLNGYSDPEYIEKLKQMNLPFRVTGKHRAFPVKGDSMPPLYDGCFVVGRFVESFSRVVNGQTYILITKEEGIVYKRVFKKGNLFELHSDNPSYQSYSVHASDILELWEFTCAVSVSDTKQQEPGLGEVMEMISLIRLEIGDLKGKQAQGSSVNSGRKEETEGVTL